MDIRQPASPASKVYRALLAQTGAGAPTATVLENSLGGTVVWTRISAGNYEATLALAFTSNKTLIFMGSSFLEGNGTVTSIKTLWGSVNVVNLYTSSLDVVGASVALADDLLSGTEIQILVYP